MRSLPAPLVGLQRAPDPQLYCTLPTAALVWDTGAPILREKSPPLKFCTRPPTLVIRHWVAATRRDQSPEEKASKPTDPYQCGYTTTRRTVYYGPRYRDPIFQVGELYYSVGIVFENNQKMKRIDSICASHGGTSNHAADDTVPTKISPDILQRYKLVYYLTLHHLHV